MIFKENISEFGVFNGEKVHILSLQNRKGSRLKLLTWGATWHAFEIKDKYGVLKDLVVAPNSLEGYLEQFKHRPYYFGNTIGRYAGRISKGGFKIKGKSFPVAHSEGVHLHGGPNGFHNKIWEIKESWFGENPYVSLQYRSKHLEGGYPGNLLVNAIYRLTEDDVVELNYSATTDEDTILNITNHTYFNLGTSSITNDFLEVKATSILDTDERLIPNGNYLSVLDSAYDFHRPKRLRQIEKNRGLDNCFVLNEKREEYQLGLYSEESGILMKIETKQPGVVIFAPEELKFAKAPKIQSWQNLSYPAICFEPQNFPDAPNHAHFPSPILRKGEQYFNEMKFSFNRIDLAHEKN